GLGNITAYGSTPWKHGLDIDLKKGDPVPSPATGKVVFAGNNKGFGKQVDSAAGIMRWYYDNVNKENWIKRPPLSYSVDGQFITPTSYATGFLYTYTPHIQGNKNFWTLWQSWFDQVYPDGTLLKAGGGSNVYILQDGKKRKFASMTALATRYDPKQIITVPSSELSRYDLGAEISLPNYAIVKSGSSYYLLDYDTKRPFASSDTVSDLGYHPDEILDVTNAELSSYKTGTQISTATANPLGEVIKLQENNSLYYLQENQYFPIYDEAILDTNFQHLSVTSVKISKLEGLVQGPPVKIKDGTLILVEGDSKVYVIEKEKKRHIASEDVFNGLGYDWDNIITVNEFTGIAHETNEPMYLRAGVTTIADLAPQIIEEQSISDLMVRTPMDQYEFIGTAFETPIDTYLIADYATGDILAGKNIDTVRPTASLAKVMTAYRLMKEGLNLNGSVTYNEAAHAINDSDFVQYRLVDGERVLNKHILEATLISSINAGARMLVSSISTEEAFITRMNEQLAAWGLIQTNLKDVYGGAVKNDTTAREYLTIFLNALSNTTVKAYMGKISYIYKEIKDLDGLPNHSDTHSNKIMHESDLSFSILASKTGYLHESGDNLTMLVQRVADGKKFVIITLGNPDHSNRFAEPKALSEWTMTNF
ncbi:hypothetical protein HN682_02355, partial [Candidatus Peregrinibacteria bacterium]|nr:hypothetical protein [Candidatus Peregrinibacteria bacterium]